MTTVWETHLEAVWHMLAGPRASGADKKKALKVAGAFWTQCIQPYIKNQTSMTTFERASVTRRGWWLGSLLHEMGYRHREAEDFVEGKDISDLPVIDYNEDAANWRKSVAQWRDREIMMETH